MRYREHQQTLASYLMSGAIAVAVAILGLGGYLFYDLIASGTATAAQTANTITLPNYDYTPWHDVVVQADGRKKPFESFAVESVRQVTGRAKFEGNDPVAVVLSWMLTRGQGQDINWEKYPFILCDYYELRQKIYRDQVGPDAPLTEEQKHGKYVSPEDLRKSPSFFKIWIDVQDIQERDAEKASQLMKPIERKVQEVSGRLALFDAISQNNPTTYGNLPKRPHPDPIHWVALDQVRGGAWFSMGELRKMRDDSNQRLASLPHALGGYAWRVPAALNATAPAAQAVAEACWTAAIENRFGNSAWRDAMKNRMGFAPQLYLGPEPRQALAAFQEQIKNGTASNAVAALEPKLMERSDALVTECRAIAQHGDLDEILRFLVDHGFGDAEFRRLAQLAHTPANEKTDRLAALVREIQGILNERDTAVISDLRKRVEAARKEKYHPDDDRWRMLHMNYLEALYPNLYRESTAWQVFPEADVNQSLSAFDSLQQAYQTGDPALFAESSRFFFASLHQISDRYEADYPGATTAALELSLNRVQPFMYSWIYMLLGMVAFIASLLLPERAAKWAYGLGFIGYVVSLGYQLFGFYCRVAISGRPPVSNMYETVVWVSFMTAIFALILELVYRRRIIIMAGALVATFGLVLADQLPVSPGFDPKISPLTPVLRSNYWLTIHVLTIVSSYAAGALAWGLGNIALAVMAFGKAKPGALKTLSTFAYRAMQIAVLLLAAGTFLGGWWAAESWGRFWGWDPKEVWALIALVCYVIPLHMRYIGWVKDFGLAVAAVVCYAAIVMSWYGVNFVLGAGLHSYGFGGGGPWWVFWAGLINIEWVLLACWLYQKRQPALPSAAEVESLAARPDRRFGPEPA